MFCHKDIQCKRRKADINPRVFIFLLAIASLQLASAQPTHTHSNLIWFGYFNIVQLNHNFSINTDLQLRTKEWAGEWSQHALRTAIAYKLNTKLSAAAGFAWFRHAQRSHEDLFFRNEWRPWEEVSLQLKAKKVAMLQRMRLEQRFLQRITDGMKTCTFDYITRLRYRFELQTPLGKGRFVPILYNELMVNPGNPSNVSFLDQNRAAVGLNIQVTPTTTLQFHFIKIHLWRTGNAQENQSVVRFNIQQQFNVN